MTALPIDDVLDEIVTAARSHASLVIEAPPGAGKTTRVPRALLEAGVVGEHDVLVLEPRRLPARLAAARVAHELGEKLGERVGYTVRFEDVGGPRTRLRFLTEGVLTRRLVDDPQLRGVGAVVLDEFHERHLHADLALALLHRLQRTSRPDLKLLVMSATLDAAPVAAYLGLGGAGSCAAVRSLGRLFPVAIEHAERSARDDARPLHERVAGAVRRALVEGGSQGGDVLVFLPGAGEIRRAEEGLAPLVRERDLALVALHGDLPLAEQDRAVRPDARGRTKVILSTNVAESSITVEGVGVVVDSGLARIATHSPWSGLPRLEVSKVSRASAVQRAGRAGRTRAGRAIRLFTEADFESRRGHDQPELLRLDLAETVLALAASGVPDPRELAWLDAPPEAALGAARELLLRLGATTKEGALTDLGRSILRFPLHPRLGRLVVEGERRGVGGRACTVAALVSERDVRASARAFAGGRRARGLAASGGDGESADLLAVLDRFEEAARQRFSAGACRALDLDPRAVEAVERARKQMAARVREAAPPPRDADAVDEALALATLLAFPDRVAKRRRPGGGEVVLSAGGAAEAPVADAYDLMVAVDVDERAERGARRAHVRLSCPIEPEALLEADGGALREREELVFVPETARVEAIRHLLYGEISLEESRQPAAPGPDVTALLLAALADRGALPTDDREALTALAARLTFLRGAHPEADLPDLGADPVRALLARACEGRVSLREITDAGLVASAIAQLPAATQRLLAQSAPERLRLPGGREVHVHYETDRPPWIESRLQDFFGQARGPAVAQGRVPLVLHLLAPNGRAVQVTQDLAGFWQKHYPALRRELGRRYPRHPWPEDGATATPPPPKPPRQRH